MENKNKTIFVANRSEIACRVFQTAREMGLRTVGIVAPGDEQARHCTFADELITVPNYLDIPSVVQAAVDSKSHLIHPGYGFLSERPAFARAVEKAGMVFIGAQPETMELMGGKIAAKEVASREKVPTLPWAKVPIGGDLLSAAKKIGFPLLLKASAGGGGKGMRRVNEEKELMEAAESASAEAKSSFGDGTLFLEKLLEKPRHIEIQVFGDGRGEGVHLHERECSLQRRHQKVWEEATAPHLPASTKQGLCEAALKLVRSTKYRNAGTIEFLVDEDQNFYFLEMNTRLQVEHPVTELITGIDLVHAQILQALYPKETILRETPNARGHAIEVRIYAEDAAQGFIPTPGKIAKLRWPTGIGIRIESGIEEGQTVGIQFDSMLAKLIVSAETRELALRRMAFALNETVILGIGTNQSYLTAILNHSQVQNGKVDTSFLQREFGNYHPEISDENLNLILQAQESKVFENLKFETSPLSESFPSPWTSFKNQREKENP